MKGEVMGTEATNVEELKDIHPHLGTEYAGARWTLDCEQTALNRRNRISNPRTGYGVSFTRSTNANVQLAEEGQRIVRTVAETPEQALEVANFLWGWLGRDFRNMPLSEVAPLFNSYEYEFNIADLLRIAESEGKRVRNCGEAGRQRFGLWEVEGIDGTFVSDHSRIRYLPAMSPTQTSFEIQNIDQMTEENHMPAPQQVLDMLVSIDRETDWRVAERSFVGPEP
jgi:hypothetical protein